MNQHIEAQRKQGVLAAAWLVSMQHESEMREPLAEGQRQIMRELTALVARCGRDLVDPATVSKLELQAHALATKLQAIDDVGRQASVMTLACRAAYAIGHSEYHIVAAHDLMAVAAYTSLSLGNEGPTAANGTRADTPTRREGMLLRFLSLVGHEILLDGVVPEAEELRTLRQYYTEQMRLAPTPSRQTKTDIQGFRRTLTLEGNQSDWMTITLHMLSGLLVRYDSVRPSWGPDSCIAALLAQRLRLSGQPTPVEA